MGKNNGNGTRTGAIKGRVQTYNDRTGQFVKRDSETGKIMGAKDTPYKSVRKDERAKTAVTNK